MRCHDECQSKGVGAGLDGLCRSFAIQTILSFYEETVWMWSRTGQDIHTYDCRTEEELRIIDEWGKGNAVGTAEPVPE